MGNRKQKWTEPEGTAALWSVCSGWVKGRPVRKWPPLCAAGEREFMWRASTGAAQGGHCPAAAAALEEVQGRAGESQGKPEEAWSQGVPQHRGNTAPLLL